MTRARRARIVLAGVELRLERRLRRLLGLDQTVYVSARVAEYRRLWEEGSRRIGASLTEVGPGKWVVERDGAVANLENFRTEIDAKEVRWKAGDKRLCHQLASECGLPVPVHLALDLDRLDDARSFLTARKGPVVVKPSYGSASGLGVTTEIRTWGELFRATVLASQYHPEFLVEAMVPGESCRVLVLNGRMIHAVRRRGVWVTGDGRATVRTLLAALPQAVPRGWLDDWTLASQGLSMDSVPPVGKNVLVRGLPAGEVRTRELRTVYTETVTGLVHPDTAARCVSLAQRLGSAFAGIDLITNDLGVPLSQSGGMFLEINTTPGIHHHYQDPGDHDRPVAAEVLRYLLDRARAKPKGSG